MTNLIKDISILSTVNEKSLEKLITFANYSICESVKETLAGKDKTTDIDIGIGLLVFNYTDSQLKTKFIPSNDLKEQLTKVYANEESSLVNALEKSVVDKIENLYKEIF